MRTGRMKTGPLAAAALAALWLAGCATDIGPSPAELKARWEAQNVFPDGYRRDLLAYMHTYLNDPTHVRGAAVSVPVKKQVGPGERYVACVRFNARNTDGKYTGSKEGAAVYVSGKLDRFVEATKELNESAAAIARQLCKDAAYAPFPELEKLTR